MPNICFKNLHYAVIIILTVNVTFISHIESDKDKNREEKKDVTFTAHPFRSWIAYARRIKR